MHLRNVYIGQHMQAGSVNRKFVASIYKEGKRSCCSYCLETKREVRVLRCHLMRYH